jgi:hypothetical protein
MTNGGGSRNESFPYLQYPGGQRVAFFSTCEDAGREEMLPKSVQSVQKPLVTSTNVVQSDKPKGHVFEDSDTQSRDHTASVRFSTNTSAPDSDICNSRHCLQEYETKSGESFRKAELLLEHCIRKLRNDDVTFVLKEIREASVAFDS